MKKITPAIGGIIICLSCNAQSTIQHSIGDTSTSSFVFWGINTTSDTGLVMSGSTDYTYGMLMKADINGIPQWSKVYTGIREFYNTIETPDGGYLSVGKSSGSRSVLMKTDSLGNVQWTSVRTTGYAFGGGRLQVLPSGDYLVAGEASGNTLHIARADTNGNILWELNYQLFLDALNYKFAEPTPDYGWIVCGSLPSSGGMCLMKLDSSGNISWQKALAPGNCFAVHADANGYFMIGHTAQAHIAIRTDTAGNSLWARQWPMNYSNNVSEYAFSVIQNGDELICYGSRYVGMQCFPVMISFDTSGNLLWSRFYSTAAANNVSSGNSAMITQDNKIVFVNCENSMNSVWYIKMDTTGFANCNDVVASLGITSYATNSTTSAVVPTANTNPWNFATVSDSIGMYQVTSLCQPLSVDAATGRNEISVYPNPSRGSITVSSPENAAEKHFQLYNIHGELVGSYRMDTDGSSNIQLPDLPPGLYLYQVVSEGEIISTGRLSLR